MKSNRLWKAVVWPVATYGCKSCTDIENSDKDQVCAFEVKGTDFKELRLREEPMHII